MKNLLSLARRSQRHYSISRLTQCSSSFSAIDSAAASSAVPATPSLLPHLMPYDKAAEDPRFLKNTSPHPVLASHKHILSAPETRVTTLTKTATVGVWIDSGSRFESEETNGTARFLMFKGTERRLVRAFEEEIVGRDQTSYYGNVIIHHQGLGNRLQNLSFRKGARAFCSNVSGKGDSSTELVVEKGSKKDPVDKGDFPTGSVAEGRLVADIEIVAQEKSGADKGKSIGDKEPLVVVVADKGKGGKVEREKNLCQLDHVKTCHRP